MGGWAKWVMGIKEGTCWDEHWVLHVSDESLNSIPEIIITLYVNQLGLNTIKTKQNKTINLKCLRHQGCGNLLLSQ